MEIQGRIIKKFPMRSGTSANSGKSWSVQEYLLETHDQYARKVIFSIFGERITQYPLNEGDEALVSFDLESRSYTGRDGIERWVTDVRAWKAEIYTGQPMGGAPAYQPMPQQQPAATAAPAQQFAAPAPAAAPAAVPTPAPAEAGADGLPF